VYVCVYAYTHTHTHTARGVLRCEPGGRDETLEGPEESEWTRSLHMCIRICEQMMKSGDTFFPGFWLRESNPVRLVRR